ncbi:hypothetical protein HMN09_00913100 [Mycena chlorophos]|uniref:Uncharacterized protein n=1 Tax=Mycena chlorophos TaxID=658473 RepID=A0A8H6VZU1_MYCCL|nr:hypothetical protein HMN09_00913100 [Mycena chlorophos]
MADASAEQDAGRLAQFSFLKLLGTAAASCHVIVKRNGLTIEETLFPKLEVPESLVVARHGVNSITASTLLAALQHESAPGRVKASPFISAILDGVFPDASVATARTLSPVDPYFAIQNGFRRLDCVHSLMSDNNPSQLYPSALYDETADLLASPPTQVTVYRDMGVSGIEENCHLIIFLDVAYSPSPLPMSPLSSSDSSLSSPSSRGVSSHGPSLVERTRVATHSQSPYSRAQRQTSKTLPLPQMMSEDIRQECQRRVANFAQLQIRATYNAAPGSALLDLVSTYTAMETILTDLFGKEKPTAGVSRTLNDLYAPVSVREVISALGWAPITFLHKRPRYALGRQFAMRQWKGAIPGTQTDEYSYYKTHCALQFIWGACNLVSNSALPSDASEWAKAVKEAHLTRSKLSALTQYTKE